MLPTLQQTRLLARPNIPPLHSLTRKAALLALASGARRVHLLTGRKLHAGLRLATFQPTTGHTLWDFRHEHLDPGRVPVAARVHRLAVAVLPVVILLPRVFLPVRAREEHDRAKRKRATSIQLGVVRKARHLHATHSRPYRSDPGPMLCLRVHHQYTDDLAQCPATQ